MLVLQVVRLLAPFAEASHTSRILEAGDSVRVQLARPRGRLPRHNGPHLRGAHVEPIHKRLLVPLDAGLLFTADWLLICHRRLPQLLELRPLNNDVCVERLAHLMLADRMTRRRHLLDALDHVQH